MAKAVPMNAVQPAAATARKSKRGVVIREHVIPRIVLLLMCGLFLLPFYWMLTIALKSNQELGNFPATLYPHDFQWGNFKAATEVFPFWRFLGNTTTVTALTVVGSAISNPFIAYGFSRIEWPGRDKIFYFMLATVFIPYPALIIALFDIYAQLKWVNTFLPLVVPFFFGNAFWIFLMRQFFMQISTEVSDAARLDGANDFRILFQIILPQAIPAVMAVSLFAALHAWNDFLGPLLYLQHESKYTLAVGLTFFQSASQYDIQYNLLMAAAALVIVPVVALFLIFQRNFVGGVSLGSIK